jgi:hypothetical protein
MSQRSVTPQLRRIDGGCDESTLDATYLSHFSRRTQPIGPHRHIMSHRISRPRATKRIQLRHIDSEFKESNALSPVPWNALGPAQSRSPLFRISFVTSGRFSAKNQAEHGILRV